jgi:hypothetical protein
MRRPVLLTLTVVGGAIALLGGTGIFAALSDTARSGTNSIETEALASSADLQIAVANQGTVPWICGQFSDDLTSPAFTLSGTTDGQPFVYCLRNIGTQTVNVSAQVEEFVDLEVGCTGDEGAYDTTCGSSGQGELGDVARAQYQSMSCDLTEVTPFGPPLLLRDQLVTPLSLGTLGPGEARCYWVNAWVGYQNEVQHQQIQTDRLTWRFAWTGQV